MVWALAKALDLVSREVSHHHTRVACLTDSIAVELGLPLADRRNLLLAALLHDAGALSLQGRLEALSFETDGITHSQAGYALLSLSPHLADVARLVLHHHTSYNLLKSIAPDLSQANIINLADRLDVMLPRRGGAVESVDDAVIKLAGNAGTMFHPDYVAALRRASMRGSLHECFSSPWALLNRLDPAMACETLDTQGLLDFSAVFSHIIDFRSRFTATHSRGVAACARKLGELSGFTEEEQLEIYLAGLLHDIGKLAISSEILEKPAGLSEDEFHRMKTHPERTAEVLGEIPGLERVNRWASQHHERVDGSGYPHGLKGPELEIGSRIMAVADIFTALSEDRPYRSGMTEEQTRSVLTELCETGALDPIVANLLFANYAALDAERRGAQLSALSEFKAFSEWLEQRTANGPINNFMEELHESVG